MTTPDPDPALPEPGSPQPAPVPAAGVAARPGAVTASAIIAFVLAAFEVVSGVLIVVASSALRETTAVPYVLGVIQLVFAALFIWGGMQAMRGATDKTLLWAVAAAAIVTVAAAIIRIFAGEIPGRLLLLVVYGVIAYLLTRPQSKEFFAAHGGAL